MVRPPNYFEGLQSFWHQPVRFWPHSRVYHFLACVSVCYSEFCGRSITVRSWQKLAWLSDPLVGPRGCPNAAELMGSNRGDHWQDLRFFCQCTCKHYKGDAEQDGWTLHKMHSSFQMVSWNVTSFRSTPQNLWKHRETRDSLRRAIVLI